MKEKLIISPQLPLLHPFSFSPSDVNFVGLIFSYLSWCSNKYKHTHTDIHIQTFPICWASLIIIVCFINGIILFHKWDHSVHTSLQIAFFLSFFQDNRYKSKLFKINYRIYNSICSMNVLGYLVIPCDGHLGSFLWDFLLLVARRIIGCYYSEARNISAYILYSYVAMLMFPKGRFLVMRLPGQTVCILFCVDTARFLSQMFTTIHSPKRYHMRVFIFLHP